MTKAFLVFLVLMIPVNALAASSCCPDMAPGTQEAPCHGQDENPASEKQSAQPCFDCAFCATGPLLLIDKRPSLGPNHDRHLAFDFPSLVDHPERPPLKPPKSV